MNEVNIIETNSNKKDQKKKNMQQEAAGTYFSRQKHISQALSSHTAGGA